MRMSPIGKRQNDEILNVKSQKYLLSEVDGLDQLAMYGGANAATQPGLMNQ